MASRASSRRGQRSLPGVVSTSARRGARPRSARGRRRQPLERGDRPWACPRGSVANGSAVAVEQHRRRTSSRAEAWPPWWSRSSTTIRCRRLRSARRGPSSRYEVIARAARAGRAWPVVNKLRRRARCRPGKRAAEVLKRSSPRERWSCRQSCEPSPCGASLSLSIAKLEPHSRRANAFSPRPAPAPRRRGAAPTESPPGSARRDPRLLERDRLLRVPAPPQRRWDSPGASSPFAARYAIVMSLVLAPSLLRTPSPGQVTPRASGADGHGEQRCRCGFGARRPRRAARAGLARGVRGLAEYRGVALEVRRPRSAPPLVPQATAWRRLQPLARSMRRSRGHATLTPSAALAAPPRRARRTAIAPAVLGVDFGEQVRAPPRF